MWWASDDIANGGQPFDAGADMFWKPNGQSQLSATINPDFGQVESDSLVVNFDAQETFFSDKRPFFTENQGIFDFGLLFDNSQLLYTRRCRLALATSWVRSSSTAASAQPSTACSSPTKRGCRSSFGALRLQRDFGKQTLGAMLTSVDDGFHDRKANVLGVDHRWQPDPSLTVSSTLVGSDIDVSGHHTRDFGFTSLAQKTLDKGWTLTGLLIHYGKDFEVNDAGYLGRNDLNYGQFEVGKRITDVPKDSP